MIHPLSLTLKMHIMFDFSEEKFPSLIPNHESGLGMRLGLSIDLVWYLPYLFSQKKNNNL